MRILTIALLLFTAACSQMPTTPEPSLRLYVFDCGLLKLGDVSAFGLSNDDTPVRELFVPCYLIRHPAGDLLFDAGLDPALAGKGTVNLESGADLIYTRSLLDQLDDLGVVAEEVELIATSHMHFDHVGAAAAFTNAKLLIQAPEYKAAFEEPDAHPVFTWETYSGLADNPRQIIDGDHDVFGDGSVVLLSAPGHTPGHQVLFLDLVETGPIVLSGDLYHFRESRALRATPVFNTSREDTLRSMDKIEAYLEETGANLWIEHEKAWADQLRKAPHYYQ